ncbi:putative thioredoxin [Neisseria gonorrhoeae]|uniref:Putative thioredoxin n=1 Tax=Neisseria gonorrhoeae TaxID=485 RepID=A0A378W2K7_NEIGO|nr:putative thioredoxin [Neisseria gonorrhoeae]
MVSLLSGLCERNAQSHQNGKRLQNKDFQVLAVAQPIDPIESVRQYVKDYGLPFTVIYDADKAVGQAFGTQVYPTSVLIGKKGEILKTYVGEPDFGKLYQEIDTALAQ